MRLICTIIILLLPALIDYPQYYACVVFDRSGTYECIVSARELSDFISYFLTDDAVSSVSITKHYITQDDVH